MKYYGHHIGDYAKDTGHLTMLEHGAYRILLDRYYSTEAGIPEQQAYRLARARSDEEKAAVDAVLEEFFELVDGIWINQRAEEELDKYSETAAESEARTENERERVRRHRQDRQRMFKDLRDAGVVPDFNIKTQDLRALHKKHCNADVTLHETLPTFSGHVSATANQEPRTINQEPIGGVDAREAGHADPAMVNASRRGKLSARLRDLGVTVTTADPHLCGWVDANVTDAELDEAVSLAREQKPEPAKVPAAYLAKIVERLVAGRNVTPIRPSTGPPSRRNAGGYKSVEQQNREAAVRAKAMLFGDKTNIIEGEVVRE